MNDDDSEDLAKRTYALYREVNPRARPWSDLSTNDKGLLICMAHYLRIAGEQRRAHEQDDLTGQS
jgi:hypothetical protein